MNSKIMTLLLFTNIIVVQIGCNKDEGIKPTSSFTFNIDGNFAPCKVTFINNSVDASSYSWDFGDGSTSTATSPTHVFQNAGNFLVNLTAKNEDGNSDVTTRNVNIASPPTKMKINSLVLKQFPAVGSDGSDWDLMYGPDVYFDISDINYNTLISSGYITDLYNSQCPVTYTSGLPYYITNFAARFYILFYDYDDTSEDDYMGGYYFEVRDFIPTNGSPYPDKLEFYSSQSLFKYTLNVNWKQ